MPGERPQAPDRPRQSQVPGPRGGSSCCTVQNRQVSKHHADGEEKNRMHGDVEGLPHSLKHVFKSCQDRRIREGFFYLFFKDCF